MPQLDRIIVFPQIFWFFIVFILFYSFIIHYFLPKFLISLKLRQQITENNYFTIIKNSNNKFKFLNKIVYDLSIIKKSIYFDFKFLDKNSKNLKLVNPTKLNFKIINVIKNNSIFCNKNILNLIKLYPSNINLKKLNK